MPDTSIPVTRLLARLALILTVTPSVVSGVAPLDTLHRNGFEPCSQEPQRLAFAGANGDAIEGWFWRSACAQEALAPAVVMLHGCSGVYAVNGYGNASNVSSRFVRWAHDLGDQGIHAFLVDSFSTRDLDDPPSSSRQDYCSARADIVAIGATEEYDRPRDALAAYAKLLTLIGSMGDALIDPDRVGLLGWSHGGSAALATVARGHLPTQPFQTAQIFYPGCGLYGAFGNPGNGTSTYIADVPTQLHIGTADTISSISTCTAHMQHSSVSQGAPMDVTGWQQAMHSFDGASCARDDNGSQVSPWTTLRYTCTGTYNGTPFSLYDWFARINAGREVTCDLQEWIIGRQADACGGPLVYP